MMKLRTNVPYELKTILRDKIQRRDRAPSRVTDRPIRESDIAEDRISDILWARNRYLSRRKELEKKRERGLEREAHFRYSIFWFGRSSIISMPAAETSRKDTPPQFSQANRTSSTTGLLSE